MLFILLVLAFLGPKEYLAVEDFLLLDDAPRSIGIIAASICFIVAASSCL